MITPPVETAGFPAHGELMPPESDNISGGNDNIDSVYVMEVAVLVYNGVFDSGLAAVLDVLDGANAMGEEISEPPTWNVTTVVQMAIL